MAGRRTGRSMDEIHHLIGASEQLIRDHGAVAVMVIIMLEALGAPAPGESLLIFASALAAQGELAWPSLFAAAWAGGVVGDNIGFAAGRYAGRALVLRYGGTVGLSAERLGRVEAVFGRYGSVTVVFSRFFAFLRQLNGLVAGTLEMDWRRFALFDALGAAMWVTVWMLVGTFVGEHSATLIGLGRRFWPAALIVAGAAVIIALFVRARTRQRPR